MSTSTSTNNTELELAHFRSQWQQELQGGRHQPQQQPQGRPTITTRLSQRSQATPGPSKRRTIVPSPTATSSAHTWTKPSHKGPDTSNEEATYARMVSGLCRELPVTTKVPQSALDHFEEASKKEDEGSLGDSLNLYRKAYRVWILLLQQRVGMVY